MLRASLLAMSTCWVLSVIGAASAFAGPHHRPHHGSYMSGAVAGGSAARPQRPVARPDVIIRPVFVGYASPFLPFPSRQRTVIIESARVPAMPDNVTVNINPIPVVMGIRRAPEAAPLIYRIEDRHGSRRSSRAERRRLAPSAGIHHLQPDTTTPRIIVVRGR